MKFALQIELMRRYAMAIEVSEYVDVKKRALELGCNIPTELALLPRNFEVVKSRDELIHEGSVPTIRVLWRQAGISETKIEKEGDRYSCVQEKAFREWIGPIIFVGISLLSQNPHAISVALGVISNYLTDWFKGIPDNRKIVRQDLVVETIEAKGMIYKRIRYEGDIEGLQQLPEIIREVSSHE
jgi:hypothetical protein